MLLRNNLRHNYSEKKLIINSINYIDVDKYRDELIKLKQELNKRNKEYQDLKVEYAKLEKENKSNLKLIELIINESNSNQDLYSHTFSGELFNKNIYNNNKMDNGINNIDNNINTNNNENNNIKDINDDISKGITKQKNFSKKKSSSLCKRTLRKIKDKYLYSKMKEEISHLKEEISEKDILMNHLKNSSKIIKLRELDNKYAETYHELIDLKDKYKKVEYIKDDYFNTKNKNAILFQQLDFYKKQTKLHKEQIEKLTLQQQNTLQVIASHENQKNVEENKKKFFKNENEKLKKQIKIMNQQNLIILAELKKSENLKKKLKTFEKLDLENKALKKQIEKYIKENQELKKKLNDKENQQKDEDNQKLNKEQNDFFMTSTKIAIDSNEEKNLKENLDNKRDDNKDKKVDEYLENNIDSNNNIEEKEKEKVNVNINNDNKIENKEINDNNNQIIEQKENDNKGSKKMIKNEENTIKGIAHDESDNDMNNNNKKENINLKDNREEEKKIENINNNINSANEEKNE